MTSQKPVSGAQSHMSPPGEQQRTSDPVERLIPLLTGVIAFITYASTLAPDLTWAHFSGDGGDLITAAWTWGIPHPPGYPTYVLLGKLAGLVPFGIPAWRFNLFSAFCAATAAGAVAATARFLLGGSRQRDIASLSAGLVVAFTPLLWSQAIVSEVYALNAAVMALFLWTLLARRSTLSAGFFAGLGLTTHLTTLLLLPMALALTPRSQRKSFFFGLASGLLPLLILPLLARSSSPVLWGDPTTPAGWWWLVSGRLYHANLGLPDSGAMLPRLAYAGQTLLQQLAWIGWLLVVLGAAAQIVPRRTAVWLALTAAFFLLYTFLYRPDDAAINLLPIIILLSPLLAAGLAQLGAWSLLVPLGLLLFNYQGAKLPAEQAVRPAAQSVLDAAPESAVLITQGDSSIFALWYFQHVEGRRADLVLVDANLLAFDWYRARLQRLYPLLAGLEEDNLQAFRAANGRLGPVCDVPAALNGRLTCLAATP